MMYEEQPAEERKICSCCKENISEKGYSVDLCTNCRKNLAMRPFPLWIKLAAGAVGMIFLYACVVGIGPSLNARIAYEKGLKAEASQNYTLAISEYKKAQQRYPNSIRILTRLAVVDYKNHDDMESSAIIKKIQGHKVNKETANELNRVIDQLAAKKTHQ